MCGIGGFCLNPKDHGKIDTDRLAGSLLMHLEVRGKHATGMAWHEGGKVRSRKAAVDATTWCKKGEHVTGATSAILHTRYATQGDPANPMNNHPIATGSVVGTHNGTLDDGHDDDLFDMLGCERHGEVDSEALFALIAHGELDAVSAMELMRGRIALAWFDTRDSEPTLHLARLHGSPLAIGQTKNGSFMYASTMDILEDAVAHADVELAWKQVVPEGQYIKVQRGVIVSCETVTVREAAPRQPRVNARPWVVGSNRPAGGKKKKKSKKSRGQRVGSMVKQPDGNWVDAAHVYEVERPVQPQDYHWDDVDQVAEAMAEADEAMMFGDVS